MNILSIVIIAFLVLEGLNIMLLYFAPGSTRGNGMGAFKAFERSKADPEIHSMVSYLVNWVAGTKLIFIALLIVILISGNETTKIFSVVALILSIASFYWRLYPIIKKMDTADQITPKGYSKTLGIMIGAFIAIFSIALTVYLVFFN
jgi:hypothetical protein